MAAFFISLSAQNISGLEVSSGLSMGGGLLLSRADGFETKSQGMSLFELTSLLSFSRFGLGLTFGYHSAVPTNLEGGYGYRAFSGLHVRAGGETYFDLSPDSRVRESSPAASRIGFSAGFGGFFSRFEGTELLFFYPSAEAAAFVDIIFPGKPFGLRYSLPVTVYFRRDLAMALSPGIGLTAFINWSKVGTR